MQDNFWSMSSGSSGWKVHHADEGVLRYTESMFVTLKSRVVSSSLPVNNTTIYSSHLHSHLFSSFLTLFTAFQNILLFYEKFIGTLTTPLISLFKLSYLSLDLLRLSFDTCQSHALTCTLSLQIPSIHLPFLFLY